MKLKSFNNSAGGVALIYLQFQSVSQQLSRLEKFKCPTNIDILSAFYVRFIQIPHLRFIHFQIKFAIYFIQRIFNKLACIMPQKQHTSMEALHVGDRCVYATKQLSTNLIVKHLQKNHSLYLSEKADLVNFQSISSNLEGSRLLA